MKKPLNSLLLTFLLLCSCSSIQYKELKGDQLLINYYISNIRELPNSSEKELTVFIKIKNISADIIEYRFNEMYLSDGIKSVKMSGLIYYNAIVGAFLKDKDEIITLKPGKALIGSFGGRYVHFTFDKEFKPTKIIFDAYGELDLSIIEKK